MLVNEFPPLPVGGAERQAERLSGFLARRGWQVLVLTRSASGLPACEQRSGFEIRRIRTPGSGKIKSLTFFLAVIGTLWKERRRYSLLHAHLAFGPALAAALVGPLLHKPVIVKLGNSGPFGDIQTSQRTGRGRFRLAILRRWVSVIIVLDTRMNAEAAAAGFQNTRLMPNGVDAGYFQPCPEKEAVKSRLGFAGSVLLLFTGRLESQKSLDTLLKGFSLAQQEHPNLRLVLVGDGLEKPGLEQLAARLGLGEAVMFAGSQTDVRSYLDAADVFVLPSLAEGISNALLEAMSCGLACIATSVGGTPEVLGTCGLLVEPDQPEALAQAISQLVSNPQQARQFGAQARQRILAEYDIHIVGEHYIQLYNELL